MSHLGITKQIPFGLYPSGRQGRAISVGSRLGLAAPFTVRLPGEQQEHGYE